MQQMGAVDVIAKLNGDGVHRLGNVMTLRSDLHQGFDRLGLWFEATVRYHFTALVEGDGTCRDYQSITYIGREGSNILRSG